MTPDLLNLAILIATALFASFFAANAGKWSGIKRMNDRAASGEVSNNRLLLRRKRRGMDPYKKIQRGCLPSVLTPPYPS